VESVGDLISLLVEDGTPGTTLAGILKGAAFTLSWKLELPSPVGDAGNATVAALCCEDCDAAGVLSGG